MCFNSLQTGRYIQSLKPDGISVGAVCCLFQFPSNGKTYPKVAQANDEFRKRVSFNSLQTGKGIQRHVRVPVSSLALLVAVSIPFKRERVSKVSKGFDLVRLTSMFQFPSNGKGYPKRGKGISFVPISREVSIPFKRERVSKDNMIRV